MKIKVGTSGFGIAQPKYVQNFSCVEVQHTFYQPPKLSTLERWRAAAPPEFEFVLKAWQLITHNAKSPTYRRLKRTLTDAEKQEAGYFRPTGIVKEAWATTLACARALNARTILFQCPASFKPTKENISNLKKFFASIDRNAAPILSEPPGLAGGSASLTAIARRRASGTTKGPPANAGGSDKDQLNFAWEPRGDWDSKVVKRLCKDLDLWHAVDPFVGSSVTPERLYFRLHGRNGWRYEYEDGELRELASLITPKTRRAYVFFNNARMTQDGLRFKEIIENC